MRIQKRRTLYAGGASWLALCAMGAGALAQNAPAALPDITVTAPSPIVKRKPAPVRVPARVAQATSGRTRGPAPQAAARTGTLPRPSKACCPSSPTSSRPSRWCRTRKSAAQAAPRSAISCSRNPASPDRALRPALPAGRSSGGSTSTASALSRTGSAATAPPISARIISCRSIRCRPTRSRSSGDRRRCATAPPRSAAWSAPPTIAFPMPCRCCAAAPFQTYGLPAKAPMANVGSPGCVTAETRTAVSSVDRGVEGGVLLDAGGGNFAVHADAFGRKVLRLQHPGLSVSVRPDPAVERTPAEFRGAGQRRVDRRLLHLRWRLHWRCDHAEQFALSHPRHRRRRPPDADRCASDQTHRQGRIPAGRRGDRSRSLLGRRHRLQAQRDWPRRSRRCRDARRAADLYQQGAGRPRRGAARAVQSFASLR